MSCRTEQNILYEFIFTISKWWCWTVTATDQWQRFTWTFTPQSQANVYPIVPDSAGIYYIWGPQLEEGAFATSYIPTSGSTVTRAADLTKITGTNFTDFHNATEGTLYGEYKSTSKLLNIL